MELRTPRDINKPKSAGGMAVQAQRDLNAKNALNPSVPVPTATAASSANTFITPVVGNSGGVMDTSPANVIGLNDQISTIQQNNRGTNTPTNPTNTPAPINPTTTTDGSVAASIAAATTASEDERKMKEELAKNTERTIAAQEAASTANQNAEEKFAADSKKNNQQKIADLTLSEAQYESEMNRQRQVNIDTLQPLKDAEVRENQAALNDAKAKAELSEYQAGIAADVGYQRSVTAFAVLGMSFTPSAIVGAQQAWQEGALKVATLKSGNAFEYAGLQKDMNKIEFAHQVQINNLFSSANEKSLAKRESTAKAITDIQDNVIFDEREKVQKIEKLKTDFQEFKLTATSRLYSGIRSANTEIDKQLSAITVKLDKDKVDAIAQINSLVANGQWDKLSAIEKRRISTRGGKTLGEVEASKVSALYTAVTAGLAEIISEDVTISPASNKIIFDAAQAYMSQGMSAVAAIKKAIQLNVSKLPEYAQSKKLETTLNENKAKLSNISVQQASANVVQTVANTNRLNAQASREQDSYDKEKAIIWRAAPSSEQDRDGYVKQYNSSGSAQYVPVEMVKTDEQWRKTTGVELLYAEEGKVIPSRIQPPAPNGGKWCGEFANDLAGRIPVGDSMAERVAGFSDTEPKVGGQVFFGGAGYDQTYGHVAVVQSINGDGTMTVKESNFANDGAIGTRVVNINTATGFYNNTNLAVRSGDKEAKNIEELLPKTDRQIVIENNDFNKKASIEATKAEKNRVQAMNAATVANKKRASDIQGVAINSAQDFGVKLDAVEIKGYMDEIMSQIGDSDATKPLIRGLMQQKLIAAGKITPIQADSESNSIKNRSLPEKEAIIRSYSAINPKLYIQAKNDFLNKVGVKSSQKDAKDGDLFMVEVKDGSWQIRKMMDTADTWFSGSDETELVIEFASPK